MVRISETSRLGRMLLALGAAVTLLTLAAQLLLAVEASVGRGRSALFGVFAFLNYFTILTNLWLAGFLLQSLLRPEAPSWLARPRVKAGLMMALVQVCWIYALIFRPYFWNPTGLQWAVDIVLHYVTPAMMIGYWVWFVPKGHLRPRDIGWWTLYPLTYFVASQALSLATGFYPYPFLDATRMSAVQIAAAGIGLGVVFVSLSLGLVAADRRLSRRPYRLLG